MEKERIEVLVRRAQNGDLQAMEQLLEAAHTPVSYQCRKMMPRPEDAQDLTQEILLAVYQNIGKLEEPKAFWSWLNRITVTRCMNALTRTHVDLQFAEDEDGHSVLDELEETDEQSIPDKAIDNAETARMIDEIVSNLPEAQRLSTLMYYYDEMSIKEIAQIMGVSENTVKSRLKLARKAIEEKVLDYEKQGVKLYSVSILPFLWYFLRNAAKNETDIGAAVACASNVMAAGTATGSVAAAAGDAAISGCAVVHFSANKVVAMILAGLVAIGGMAFGAILAVNKCCYPVPDTMCLHEWTDAGCTNPKICCKCDSTEGEALGHNWVEVNCETPQLCTICGATKGEISGHKWEEANCEMPKTCIICGETVGDVVHVWREANYQMPESCSICGTTNGRALTAAFETYGLSITDVELGRKYSYVTSCNSQPYKTTGQAVFSHFRVFEGDETHKAVDDYEWYSVAVDITFNDEYAQSYGMYPFVFYCDYYTGGVWACDSENPKTEVGTIFTINYCGENYTECMIYSKDAGSLGWVGNTCIYHCEFNYRVPVGYDGIMFGLLDPSVDPQEDETVADFADDNTLLFRLDNSFAMEGYEPITLVSYTQINDNWYVMQDCAVFAEPSDESEQLLSCEKGRVVMVYCNGTNGWSYGTLRGVTGYIRTEYMVDELPDNPGTRWTLQIVGVGQGFIYVEVPDLAPKPAGRADPETGLSWDGVSPIIYTYPDGTRGTEPIEGATYEALPGVIATYHVYHDEVGRVLDSTCRDCGKTIKNDSRGKYCVQFPSEGGFCTSCGQDVEPYTCHTCTNYTDGTSYCVHCRKVEGNGSEGTCVRWSLGGGDRTCPLCNATVPMHTCHTCGEQIDMAVPGTLVDSTNQLTEEHKKTLLAAAEAYVDSLTGAEYDFVSMYTFVLTDSTQLSSKSKCCCFFIVAHRLPQSDSLIYHTGDIFDMYIREDGSLSYRLKVNLYAEYDNEKKAAESYEGYADEIAKIL